ncbi:MAG: CRISPR system precrRNA processing endoribonuclease RAMP protein Cas6 [Desulfuromonadaceae bacterium]|nr:CRISPR system precrRNA processing endoribonuclease RAMP protein Cas6 [Desulfuromonadaceae bacterium]MDD2849102.1 CRISPR system precrRNA processing endoribonuclease RAMP protein Cas6 [Desulfuromonadaceae bacterium]MDD4129470.1 CRISPR system precrRNA processing endoribonuclease RAMP protein Cas6 [Desulfuromonadaceae bacterium]
MELDFVRIECEIVTEVNAQLSTALHNALRDFEQHFRSSSCADANESCARCDCLVTCPYRIVFDQRLSSDPETVRRHQKPSLPFSLYIHKAGVGTSTCTVGLVIVGSALNYIELFHTTLIRMVDAIMCAVLNPSKYEVRTYSLDYQSCRHEITYPASIAVDAILLSAQHILQNTVHCNTIRLVLQSPLRLLNNGAIAHQFDFAMFFRSQLRRCSSLCAYYGAGEFDLDFTGLSDGAQNVTVFDDRIHYTQPAWSKRLNMAGLVGTVKCSGLLEPMFSLLLLGSYFNAGKGATYGFGFHRLEGL